MSKFENLAGQRFGKLLIIERVEDGKRYTTRWSCVCDCGNIHISGANHLKSGDIYQCKECGIKQKSIHGMCGNRIYNIYCGMTDRCYHKNSKDFPRYGGRGINICDEWRRGQPLVFKEWAYDNGYTDKLSIDRIDNDKGYSPDNCKWSTMKEQQNNKRNNVALITYKDETKTLTDWAELNNISYGTLRYRLNSGWDIERAFTEKVGRQGNIK